MACDIASISALWHGRPHFSVVTYDRRGRGDSGQGTAWTAEREVEDLRALIDAVGGSASR